MCKVCDKTWYFDSMIHYSDGGYGDDDIDKVSRNVINTFICPACGKLRPTAEKIFGSILKALAFIMIQNMDDKSTDEEKIAYFKNVLWDVNGERKVKVLEKNNLKIEDNKLYHDCGLVLLKGIKSSTDIEMSISKIEEVLEKKEFYFCPKCGKKILPFNHEISEIPTSTLFF